MSMQPQLLPEIPEDTARLARVLYKRKGNIYVTIGDQIGPLFADVDFADLYAADGKPALSPNRLAMVVIFQFMEDLSDREAAEAVVSRIDWKYALHLSLTDLGFDYSVLSDFRDRLLQHDAALRLFERLLQRLAELGFVRSGGRQRTDGTYVLTAARALSRVELVAETMRLALELLADERPDWLRSIAQSHWYERYSTVWTSFRLPKSKDQRDALALAIGADGFHLLQALDQVDAPSQAGTWPEVATLRQVWQQQFEMLDGKVQWRSKQKIPPGGQLIVTPHDVEARPGRHGERTWKGYGLHVTETCDTDQPHVITDVLVVPAAAEDTPVLAGIQDRLAQRHLAPTQHLVDTGYTAGHTLTRSRERYGVDLVGPVAKESNWQAQDPQGVTTECFHIDWIHQQATCPQGQRSVYWSPLKSHYGQPVVEIRFPASACQPCPLREHCTHSKEGRALKLSIYHDTILAARRRQETAAFRETYRRRAGIESTISEAVNSHGIRRSRYVGLARTTTQALLTAIAINLKRVALWLMAPGPRKPRPARLTCLAPA
jgi:transposase